MARQYHQYRSMRRNTGKRLKSKIRGGAQAPPNKPLFNMLRSVVTGAVDATSKSLVAAISPSVKEKLGVAVDAARSGVADAAAISSKGLLTVSNALRSPVPAPPPPPPTAEPAKLSENDIIELLRVITFNYPKFLEGMQRFNSADLNGDGSLNSAEFGALMRSMITNMTSETIAEQFKIANTAGDNSLSLLEFLEYYTQITKPVEN